MSTNSWVPCASIENLRKRAQIISSIREFFDAKNFLEVDTPILSKSGNTDPHIESLSTKVCTDSAVAEIFYLHTSPEFAMKRLLAAGHGPIYQIAKVFRDAERGRHHNVEFTMLEWYQPGFDHIQLMHQVSELLMLTLKVEQCEYKSYQNLFEDTFSINPHKTSATELKFIAFDHDIHINTDSTEKDFWLDLLMTHIIEPTLGHNYPIFIYDYPESQAALAKIRQGECPVAERFEVYYRGIELANGFHELLDAHEQLARFKKDLSDRKCLSKQEIPIDENFIAALSHGLPNCAGVALGIDRLCMLAIGEKSISEIISFANE